MSYAQTNAKRIGGTAGQSPLDEVLAAAGSVLSQFLEARRGRRELTRLANYDDALLADIGIARSDIEQALLLPWYSDPSQALEERVHRRNGSARWARSYQIR